MAPSEVIVAGVSLALGAALGLAARSVVATRPAGRNGAPATGAGAPAPAGAAPVDAARATAVPANGAAPAAAAMPAVAAPAPAPALAAAPPAAGAPGPDAPLAGPAEVDTLVGVLAALRAVAAVVGPGTQRVRATTSAYALGLAGADGLRHAEIRELVDRAVRSGGTSQAQLELPRGTVGSVSIVVDARATSLGHGMALLLVEDRSEARRVDEVRRDFVANVSHELKTPVGAISLLAETMADAADDPEAIVRFAGRMRLEAERLSRLVQDIIELSRLQVDDALTSTELIDVDRLVRDAVDQARWRAEAQRIEIGAGPPTGLRTYGDHDLLTTAVRNLLDNAITYSPPRTRVSVTVVREGAFVEIRVTDRGDGIPLADQSRIFERFYRVDPARSRQTGGTGLGLAIVKHIVENHGGDVTVRSAPGEGSTFTLRLPVGAEAAPTGIDLGQGPADGVDGGAATGAAGRAALAAGAEP